MSKSCVMLCSSLLKEHFGEIVERVAAVLVSRGSRPLKQILFESGLPLEKVKKALCVLIQHNMVEYAQTKPRFIEYKLLIENVLLLTRYPRYIYCAKTLYGDIGELLVEELLNNGQMTMETVIGNVSQRLAEAMQEKNTIPVSTIKEKFSNLVNAHFVQRCPAAVWEKKAILPQLIVDEHDMFRIPDTSTSFSQATEDEPPSKKLKTGFDSTKDLVYWRVNTNRFHQYFRDQAIISAVIERCDEKAGEIVRALLRIAETTSNPWAATTVHIGRFELLKSLLKDTNIKEKEMDSYLALLCTDDAMGFVSRVDERAGGMYIVNIRKALQKLAEAITISVVQDKYGSKCCRIFRLLLMKKYLEQKQIEELAMILSKDAKDYTYKMLKENFITVQEVPRTSDHAPSRTFYLFHVNLNQLCRVLLDQCYKVIFNSISRRNHETKEHKRLLEKKQRVDAIVTTLQQSGTDSAQIQEVEDMISPSENAQLERVKHTTNKLDYSEIQVDETIFILSMWLQSLNK